VQKKIDVTVSEARRDTRVDFHSSFLLKGIMSMLKGPQRPTNATKASPYSLVSKPQRLAHASLSDRFQSGNWNVCTKVRACIHNLIGCFQQPIMELLQHRQALGATSHKTRISQLDSSWDGWDTQIPFVEVYPPFICKREIRLSD
jgi:hypothetical protein